MNWLGFSLSSQELPNDHHHHDQISTTDVSGAECAFDLASHESSAPSLGPLPPSFSILEAFNRNNQPQNWNMKGLGLNRSEADYKTNTTSDFSVLMATTPSCSNQYNNETQNQPKLENFLGRHSLPDHQQEQTTVYNSTGDHYMFPDCSLQLPSETIDETSNGGVAGGANTNMNNSSIGLSMIKTWLRNQPAPSHTGINKNDGTNITNAQSLSLSMSTGSQSSSALPLLNNVSSGGEISSSSDNKQQKGNTGIDIQTGVTQTVLRKSIDTFGQRTSIYRGVTRHRWTGRYEAHLWDNSCRREGQTRKGRQVYLGGYDKEEKAARSYDLAALKYWGTTTTTNFPINNYEKELEEMKHMTRQEYVASLRRKSSGFSRGASIYRGVTRHHQHGRWQARIGRVAGNKDLYLGTFSTQEEAAEAYDVAAIKFRGLSAVTNFDMSRYDVKSILESTTLPIGSATKRLKEIEQANMITAGGQRTDDDNTSSSLTNGINSYATSSHYPWSTPAFQQPQPIYNIPYPYGQKLWCKEEHDADSTHGFHHDVRQLQLGNSQNFLQHNLVLQNMMSTESASLEHSSGSNSVMYSNVGGGDGNNGGYVIPMSTILTNDNGYDQNVIGYGDPYNARNMNHLSQQSAAAVKSGGYDQGLTCSNWVPMAVPTLAPRSTSGNMAAVCHGAPAFTIWNDT